MDTYQTFAFTLLLLFCWHSDAEQIIFVGSSPKIISVPAGGAVILTQLNISPDTAYIVCQVHVQTGHVTLSQEPSIHHDTAVTGKDIGVVSLPDTLNMTWFLFSNNTQESKALVHLTHYTGSDPLPGGCNEEFNLENDPNIHLAVQPTKTTVQFQRSNTGQQQGLFPSCVNKVYQSHLEYHVYVHYIQGGDFSENTYFDILKKVLTAADTTKHATWLQNLGSTEKSELDISSYKQQGVIYTVVVKDTVRKTEASYIPVVTYACDIDKKHSCQKIDVADAVFATVGALIGLFLCFLGHKFFKTENFIFGFIIFALICYQVIALETSISDVGTISLGVVFGLIGGALLLALWWYKGIPVLSVLIISLVTGYLISSIVFYTPMGNLSYWKTPFNYAAIFMCGVLIVPVILLFFTRVLNILSCAMIGSYLFIVALDTYIMGGMRYIVLNSLRHGTDRTYINVVVSGPFTTNEIALTLVWLFLCVSGMVFQLYQQRKKAPFPPCPRQLYDRSADLRRLLKPSTEHTPPDREPLIRGGNSRQYGAVQQRPINGDSYHTDEEEDIEEQTNANVGHKA